MTIAISVRVHDGVVLASDSASTLSGTDASGPTGVIKVYNHANKIINLVKGKPIGVVTWGLGAIGEASTATLLKDFRHQLTQEIQDDYTIEDVAKKLRAFLLEQPQVTDAALARSVSFLVAGFSANAASAEEFQVDVAAGICNQPRRIRPANGFGLTWGGDTESIGRLVLGFAPALPALLQEIFGLDDARVASSIAQMRPHLEAPLVLPPMPIQDAIDLAEFLVQTAIGFRKFMPGPQTVGGPIEIAAITKHEGFKWVKRKHFYKSEFNPEVAR